MKLDKNIDGTNVIN